MLSEPREAQERSSTFRLTAAQPRQIHLTTQFAGNPQPVFTRGIYLLRGKELTYCVGAPGRSRPDAFRTVPGDKQTLVSLKRIDETLIVAEVASGTRSAWSRPQEGG